MPERIDEELEKLTQEGQSPKKIYVGASLYFEIENEQNPVYAAELLSPGQAASAPPMTEEPTEYNGIELIYLEDEEPDYLRIEV